MLSDGDAKTHQYATHHHATYQHATCQHAAHAIDEAIVRPSLSLSLSPYGSLQILIELNGETGFPVNEPYLQFAAGISTPIRRDAARGGRPAATGCVAGT